jgi:hypothetical protein
LATIGTTVAAMMAPGKISRQRRTRRVSGMWPHQPIAGDARQQGRCRHRGNSDQRAVSQRFIHHR